MVRLVVDGIVYGFRKHSGIAVMFNAVLPRLSAIHNVPIKLLLPRKVLAEVPNGSVACARRDFLPEKTDLSWKLDKWVVGPSARFTNSLLRDIQVGPSRGTVFQSTFFTWTHRRVPHVAAAYDMNHELYPELYSDEWGRWLRKQYRDYLMRATRIISISEKTKRDIQDIYGIEAARIDVAHLAADRSVFHPEAIEEQQVRGLPSGWLGRYLLYVGGRQHYKNFAVVLEALAKLPIDICCGLVVAGTRLSSAEEKLIQTLRIKNRVCQVIDPSDGELRRLYCGSFAFIYPSLHEGFGLPLLEAMSCQTAVIAANTEIFREVADDAAFYFTPTSSEELAESISRLALGAERLSLIDRGTKRLGRFSWDNCALQMYRSYCQAISDWN